MNKENLAHNRAFNEAMRARLRLIAHERNLPKDEIKKVMGLKHLELIHFVQRHQLSWEWLLEGDLRGLRKMVSKRRLLA
jgi:hypothetical protein